MNSKNHLVTFVVLFLIATTLWANPHNIAPKAVVTVSTTMSKDYNGQLATDGIIGVADQGEWACEAETIFWGYIRYPWIKLDWGEKVHINRVIVYDRPALDEHTAGGRLIFSDGSRVNVTAIPNDGTARMVTFPEKEVEWVKFEVMDGDGDNLGLSEIEVYPSHEGYGSLVDFVNPFIETTRGRYFYFTPGSTPFGMIASGPHTRNKNQWGGGYNYNTTEILGFGQLHGWMLSGIEIMPTTGNIDPRGWQQAWKSSFSHDDEIAQPGYYRVFLRDYKIWVEQTATDRVSMYKFRFTENGEADILTNLGGYMGSTTMTQANVEKINNQEIQGSFVSAGRMWGGPKEVKVFFVIQFDKPFDQLNGWNDQKILSDVDGLVGPDKIARMDSMTYGGITQSYYSAPTAGVSAVYQTDAGEVLKMKVAISYTSVDNAKKNLLAECDHWDFDRVKQSTQDIWNDWLGKITVKGGTDQQQEKFYTDLWHVVLGRKILNDVNGYYPDYTDGVRDWKYTHADLKVRQLPMDDEGQVKYNMYNSDALWLTQWNVNVLWGLAWPHILDDFSASMVQYADNGGLLPRGPCAGGYSYIMTGCPATNMLVSAYMKGMLTKVDAKHTFETIKRNHLPGGMMGAEDDVRFYMQEGWCPGNAGETLEWTFQDWALAQMANKLGKQKDYNIFSDRSDGWKHLYRQDQQLLFPKDKKGEWLHDDPLNGGGWVEANAWQGTWSISHDIHELSEKMGGKDQLCEKLNHAFEQAAPDDFVFGYSNGYVSYANQPGCSNAHVFNHAGKPWLSQYWVRRVNEQAYGATTPDEGYGGHDEDQGQMGGVSALMSMGLFSLRGNTSANPIYEITSPVFDQITIQLDPNYYSGKAFVIRTNNNSKENMYIQKAELNGEPLNRVWISHEEYARGGRLELWLGPEPNKEWGLENPPEKLD